LKETERLIAMKCNDKVESLSESEVIAYLRYLSGWSKEKNSIAKVFAFQNFYETLAFINAIAAVIHSEDHHPEIVATFNQCVLSFDTHSVNEGKGGISINDFICAAKIDLIYASPLV
jgi:4a-hydroxytetrahydrobiopterin dehydratase